MIGFQLSDLARRMGLERLTGDARITGVSTDSRTIEPGQLFVALQGEIHDGHRYIEAAMARGAAGALVSRWQDLDIPQLLCPDTLIGLGQMAALWRAQSKALVIGVTGSNGKTTVKSMLHGILAQRGACLVNAGNYNNEIGLPLTLCRLSEEHLYAVTEMGAARPGDITYLANLARPRIGVVNNAAPAHLQGMTDVAGVARVKGELIAALPEDGVAIINADDDHAPLWRELAGHRQVMSFGFEDGEIRGRYQRTDGGALLALKTPAGDVDVSLGVVGRHNAANGMAAAAAGLAAGASLAEIVSGLEAFTPVDGRLQVHDLQGWTLIEDSYNANPGSLRAGIHALMEWPGEHWLVLGDMAELGDDADALHFQAGSEAKRLGVTRLLCIGELMRHAADGFGDGAEHFSDRDALLERFAALLQSGVVCMIKGSRSMRMEQVAERMTALEVNPCC